MPLTGGSLGSHGSGEADSRALLVNVWLSRRTQNIAALPDQPPHELLNVLHRNRIQELRHKPDYQGISEGHDSIIDSFIARAWLQAGVVEKKTKIPWWNDSTLEIVLA